MTVQSLKSHGNNPTDINKTSNHLSHKLIEHKDRTRHMAFKIKVFIILFSQNTYISLPHGIVFSERR